MRVGSKPEVVQDCELVDLVLFFLNKHIITLVSRMYDIHGMNLVKRQDVRGLHISDICLLNSLSKVRKLKLVRSFERFNIFRQFRTFVLRPPPHLRSV